VPTTIHEIPHEDPSFKAFLDERERQRALAIEQYRRVAEDIQNRLATLTDQERALYDEMVTPSSGLGDRFRARTAAKKARKESEKEIRRTLGAELNTIATTWNLSQPASALRQSYDDYANAVVASADSDRLDPVLVAIPSSRVREERGWKVYSKRSALFGSTELARVLGNTIAVGRSNEDSVRAAILIAKDRCLPPLKFNGTDKFVALARRIAAEYGLSEGGVPNTVSGAGPQAPSSAASHAPSADAGASSSAAQRSADLLQAQFATLADLGVTAASEIGPLDAKARIAQDPRREFIVLARNADTIILLDKSTRDTVRSSLGRFADPDRIVPGAPFHLHVDANDLLAFGAGAGVRGPDAPVDSTTPQPVDVAPGGEPDETAGVVNVGDVTPFRLQVAFEAVADGRSICDARELPSGAEIDGVVVDEALVDGHRFGLLDTGALLVVAPLSADQPFDGEVTLSIGDEGSVGVQERSPASPPEVQQTDGHEAPSAGELTPKRQHGGRGR
jgi:hypothetical protein